MTRVYYKEAVAAIVVFDITNRKTFGAVDAWLKDVREKLDVEPGRPLPFLLLANKTDMLKEKAACVDDAELDAYVADNGLIGVYKTSAKDNDQIADAMRFLVGKLRENEPQKPLPTQKDNETFTLTSAPANSQNSNANQNNNNLQAPCCR